MLIRWAAAAQPAPDSCSIFDAAQRVVGQQASILDGQPGCRRSAPIRQPRSDGGAHVGVATRAPGPA